MTHVHHEIAQVFASEGARLAVLLVDDHYDIPLDAATEHDDNPAVRFADVIRSHDSDEAVARVGQVNSVSCERHPHQFVEQRRRRGDVYAHLSRHPRTLSRTPVGVRPRNR